MNTNDNWPEAEIVTPTWTALLPSLLEAYSFLNSQTQPTAEQAENLSVLRDEFIKMAHGADMMNKYSDFIQQVYLIAFGCDCDDKTDEDVLKRLTEITSTIHSPSYGVWEYGNKEFGGVEDTPFRRLFERKLRCYPRHMIEPVCSDYDLEIAKGSDIAIAMLDGQRLCDVDLDPDHDWLPNLLEDWVEESGRVDGINRQWVAEHYEKTVREAQQCD